MPPGDNLNTEKHVKSYESYASILKPNYWCYTWCYLFHNPFFQFSSIFSILLSTNIRQLSYWVMFASAHTLLSGSWQWPRLSKRLNNSRTSAPDPGPGLALWRRASWEIRENERSILLLDFCQNTEKRSANPCLFWGGLNLFPWNSVKVLEMVGENKSGFLPT